MRKDSSNLLIPPNFKSLFAKALFVIPTLFFASVVYAETCPNITELEPNFVNGQWRYSTPGWWQLNDGGDAGYGNKENLGSTVKVEIHERIYGAGHTEKIFQHCEYDSLKDGGTNFRMRPYTGGWPAEPGQGNWITLPLSPITYHICMGAPDACQFTLTSSTQNTFANPFGNND
jgi:hypothetical protein